MPSRPALLAEQRRDYADYLANLRRRRSGAAMTETAVSLSKAINAGLRRAMENDDRVLMMGEDVGTLGGVFRVTDGLQKDFGEKRVIDTPLAESGIVGTAIGLAMRGYRPVCEIQFDGFVYPAFNQIVSQLAKMHYRSRGALRDARDHPDPLRRRHRRGRAPQRESGGLLRPHGGAEGRRLQRSGRRVRHDPAGDRQRRSGDVLRAQDGATGRRADVDLTPERELAGRCTPRGCCVEGADATLVTYGPSVQTALSAARGGAEDGRLDLGVIDLRSSVAAGSRARSSPPTGAPVMSWSCSEAPPASSLAADIAAQVSEAAFYSLEAPVLRVGGFDTPYPTSRQDAYYLPDIDRILDAVDRSLAC